MNISRGKYAKSSWIDTTVNGNYAEQIEEIIESSESPIINDFFEEGVSTGIKHMISFTIKVWICHGEWWKGMIVGDKTKRRILYMLCV